MEVDPQDGPAAGWTWATPPPPPPPVTSDARPSVSARAGVPAAGRGSQINPDQSMRGVDLVTTPLAHPTGIESVDSLTSPLGLASLAAGGVGIARAGVVGGAGAAIKAGAQQVGALGGAVAKFELTRAALVKMGVPSRLADYAAAAIVYKTSGHGAPVAEEAPSGPHLDRSAPMRPSELTSQQLAERVKFGTGTPPPAVEKPMLRGGSAPSAAPAEPIASGPVAPAPPAVASTRTDVPPTTAAVPPEAPPAAPASLGQALVKVKLKGTEILEVQRLTKKGMPLQEALDLVQAQRDFQTRFGLKTPTSADTKFPKGMRGGAPE